LTLEPILFEVRGGRLLRLGGWRLRQPDAQPGENYYYVRVIQKDGQMAWSSPIWVLWSAGAF
jgi:hypothetical protein